MTADEETAEKADGENGDGGMTAIWDEENEKQGQAGQKTV
jgi:hypothetical protein